MDNTNEQIIEKPDQTTEHSHDDGQSSDHSLTSSTIVNNIELNPPNHAEALARIFVGGLSLFCFNRTEGNQRAELGFINAHHSTIKMEIFKNTGIPFWSTERDFPFPSTKNITITINADKPNKLGKRYERDINDIKDFRHMPNLAELHILRKFEFRGEAKRGLNARVNIQDAVFYTHTMSKSMATFHRIINDVGTPHQRRRIGRILGADIFNEQNIVVKINIPGVAEPYVLPPLVNDGSKYTILLRTIPHDDGSGHMKQIYTDVINNDSEKLKFDIEFDKYEEDWNPFFIGDNRFGDGEYGKLYAEGARQFLEIPEESRRIFYNLADAEKANYKLVEPIIAATKFACEGLGGGEGPLPEPPEAP